MTGKKSISMKVDADFHNLVDKVRKEYKQRVGITIGSQRAVTKMMAKNPRVLDVMFGGIKNATKRKKG